MFSTKFTEYNDESLNKTILDTQSMRMSFHYGQMDLTSQLMMKTQPEPLQLIQSKLIEAEADKEEEVKGVDFESSSETQSDTSSEEENVEVTVKPMLDILKLSTKPLTYVISSQAGLVGDEVVGQYPCVLDAKKFFVFIGQTDITVFDKSTFMNIANFAEEKGAEEMILILNRNHEQKAMYTKMFKVIDAKRVKTPAAQDLIKKDLLASVLDVCFFRLTL